MRILQIIIGLDVGGAELMLKRLIESHRGNPNYQYMVISLTNIGKVGEQLQALGVEVRALGMRSALDIPWMLWRIVRQIRAFRPDIVQTWMYHANLLGGLAARLAGCRNVIWGIRSTDLVTGTSRLTYLIAMTSACLSGWLPKAIVCVAERAKTAHVKLGYDSNRIVVIPNGVAIDSASYNASLQTEQTVKLPDGAKIVGTVGRFNPYKDFHNFVKAAGIIGSKTVNVYFLMIGRGLTKDNTELMRWVSSSNCADRFIFLGEKSDVTPFYSLMDVFCLSSRSEGFPNVVAEAMAMSVPCVVTDAGDAAVIVGDTGIVVPIEDSQALADGLMKILDRPAQERQLLGVKARRRIMDRFSLVSVVRQYEELYEKTLYAPNAC